MLGLPYDVRACLFDLDGVLAKTAEVHAAVWKEMFDTYRCARAANTENGFIPFDAVADYDDYVDGKPRYEGVESFLASRRISLPREDPSDAPDAETIAGLGNRGIEDLFDVRIDGIVAARGQLRGKPAPDTSLAAAHALETEPPKAAAFEDALAGVAAAKAGGFCFVVGVDRVGPRAALLQRGADRVVSDLDELLLER